MINGCFQLSFFKSLYCLLCKLDGGIISRLLVIFTTDNSNFPRKEVGNAGAFSLLHRAIFLLAGYSKVR